ncbi:hypothetical protein RD110_20230 [Rhodoferax koreense]|uniref:Uncharacterized protein n=1 Tax=Rhodoferax koreensis TaxID=1842727 RepID=A0A1P8JZS7_9BURK|nr:hypothetical protein [Rhodoferax koreense]APW39253.1 hypothetical protein RD110_20230 [Rhodoferax koreense]
MTEPILVIHGVNNHDFPPFQKQVDQLQQILGQGKRLVPVYWGDLGGQSTDLADCLPAFSDGEWHVRADEGASPSLSPQAVRALVARAGPQLDNAQRADLVSGQVQPDSLVRGAPGVQPHAVRDAVADELGTTQVLQHIDDPETLAIVGRAIDAVLRDLPHGDAAPTVASPAGEFAVGGGYAVRGGDAPGEVEAVDTRALLDPVKRIAGHVLHGIDEALGRFVGNQLGRLNQDVRARLAVPISATLGDIMSYQRQPDQAQKRLRDALAQCGPDWGTQNKPISVVAHSLGGVIAFDAAVKPASEDKRLWIRSFLTFGSQAAFFHIVDPRRPELATYRRDTPVKLPPSIGRWTNLWDPMDLLAFTAGTVFRLADGSQPTDIAVQDTATELVDEKGWAHSIYWESDELASALRKTLAS